MKSSPLFRLLGLLPVVGLTFVAGCDRDDSDFGMIARSTDPIVFDDEFVEGVSFQPFLDSYYEALQLAVAETYGGSAAALRFDVQPSRTVEVGPGEFLNRFFTGGVIVAPLARDLSGYNAVRLQAKANRPAILNEIGLGNDNTDFSQFGAAITNVALSTEWREIIIPIPNPAALTATRGLLYFSEGFEGDESEPYFFFFDQIEYVTLRSITNPRPRILGESFEVFTGTTLGFPSPAGSVLLNVDGRDVNVSAAAAYFDFTVTVGESVARIGRRGIEVFGAGTATIQASLGGTAATGTFQIAALAAPTDPAPTPTYAANDVISLFSDGYAAWPVDSFRPGFVTVKSFDLAIAGNTVKAFTGITLSFPATVVIQFESQLVDATTYDGLRFDLWVPETGLVAVSLRDFGPNGIFEETGGDDSVAERGFGLNEGEIVGGQWNTFEIPLTDFESSPPALGSTLASRAQLAQFILRGDIGALFIDNLMFYRE